MSLVSQRYIHFVIYIKGNIHEGDRHHTVHWGLSMYTLQCKYLLNKYKCIYIVTWMVMDAVQLQTHDIKYIYEYIYSYEYQIS